MSLKALGFLGAPLYLSGTGHVFARDPATRLTEFCVGKAGEKQVRRMGDSGSKRAVPRYTKFSETAHCRTHHGDYDAILVS